MGFKNHYKIDTKELTTQIEMLASRQNKCRECLMKYKKHNFIASYYKCKATGKATSETLHKFKHIGIDVSKLLSAKDFDFIFGN